MAEKWIMLQEAFENFLWTFCYCFPTVKNGHYWNLWQPTYILVYNTCFAPWKRKQIQLQIQYAFWYAPVDWLIATSESPTCMKTSVFLAQAHTAYATKSKEEIEDPNVCISFDHTNMLFYNVFSSSDLQDLALLVISGVLWLLIVYCNNITKFKISHITSMLLCINYKTSKQKFFPHWTCFTVTQDVMKPRCTCFFYLWGRSQCLFVLEVKSIYSLSLRDIFCYFDTQHQLLEYIYVFMF